VDPTIRFSTTYADRTYAENRRVQLPSSIDSNGVVTWLDTPVALIDEPCVGSRIFSLVAFHGLTSAPLNESHIKDLRVVWQLVMKRRGASSPRATLD
jgi:hypothetical protein